jgi:hypothetical protein
VESGDNSEGEEEVEDGEWKPEPLADSDVLCLRLRVGLKRIAARALDYANSQIVAIQSRRSFVT